MKHKKTKRKASRKKKPVDGLIRGRVLRIYPTIEQRNELRKWFGTARYCYNQVIAKHKNDALDYDTIREEVLNNIEFEHKNVNLEVKRAAITEALIAINNGGNSFQFRSKKDHEESIHIRKECVSELKQTVFPKTFQTLKVKGGVIKKPSLDGSRVIRKRNRYYIFITEVRKPEEVSLRIGGVANKCVALDPGTYTFMDYYSNLDCGKIAPEAGPHVHRLCRRIDKLISKKDKTPCRKLRYHLKRAITKARIKLQNKKNDLHWKVVSFLCDNYSYIFLPHFETSSMSKKSTRRIRSKTVRQMLTLSHYSFFQKLKSKAEEKNVLVYKLNEHYTSKLCGRCFTLNNKLRLIDRTYHCKSCKLKIDRDFNAARNIFIHGLQLIKEQRTFGSLRWEVPPL